MPDAHIAFDDDDQYDALRAVKDEHGITWRGMLVLAGTVLNDRAEEHSDVVDRYEVDRGQQPGPDVERHLTAAELEDRIADADDRLKERLVFVRLLYDGDHVNEAARKLGRSRKTGEDWFRRWNEDGVDGLRP
ncbi:MAG: helix-turn-helix domain-containing protein [Candidatus Nanohaloarchaea archaeon]